MTLHTRQGHLLDVNPVARLLRASAHELDIDGDGVPDGPADPGAVDATARMLLAHLVLASGELWVTERDGEIVAASVWVPGGDDAASVRAGALDQLLRRELKVDRVVDAVGPAVHLRPALESAMAEVGDLIQLSSARLVLFAVAVAPHVEPHDVVTMARTVVEPVLSRDEPVLAVAIDDGRGALLRQSGFATVGRVPLGEGNEVWLGGRRPALVA